MIEIKREPFDAIPPSGMSYREENCMTPEDQLLQQIQKQPAPNLHAATLLFEALVRSKVKGSLIQWDDVEGPTHVQLDGYFDLRTTAEGFLRSLVETPTENPLQSQ